MVSEDTNLRQNLLEIYMKALCYLYKHQPGSTAYKQTELLAENLELMLDVDRDVYVHNILAF